MNATADTTPSPQGNPARKKALTAVAAVVVAAGLGYAAYWALVLNHFETTDNAYVQGNVVQLTPQAGGTVVAINANDTDHVKAGQWLVRLDPADAKVAQSTVVTVAYDSPVDQVMVLLAQACAAQPRVLTDPAPLVALSAFGADGLEFTVSYWFEDPASGQLKSDINRAILSTLHENGVVIPFSQRLAISPSGTATTNSAPGKPATAPK